MNVRIATVSLLLVAALGGPWAWFNLLPPAAGERFELRVARELAGYRFVAEPLSEQVKETLATTNLFNGTFYGPNRVIVFAADWDARDSRQMTVVQHTPDECWVNSGMKVIGGLVPSRVEVPLDGRSLPFECRVFQTGAAGGRELVLWTTLLSGLPLEEGSRFVAESGGSRLGRDGRGYQDNQSRIRRSGQFLTVLKNRLKATGRKQFVRFSMPLLGAPGSALEEGKALADNWLSLTAISDK